MPPKPNSVQRIETTWLREYAKTYLPSESGFSFSDDDLRASGVNLIQVRQIFRKGYVVSAEKLDGPGALWTVEGQDNEENWFCAIVKVVSEELDVTLIEFVPMQILNGVHHNNRW